MNWDDRGRSRNLEDRRGQRGPSRAGLSLGIGGIVVVAVLSLLTGTDLFSMLGITPGTSPTVQAPPSQQSLQAEEATVHFVSFVLDDVQQTWSDIFDNSNLSYHDAKLVLYRDAVDSGCGVAPASTGPFYCPVDAKVYLDLSFYDELKNRFGAPGDFAQAYVIAHELGHHVQDLIGTSDRVDRQEQANPSQANRWSVALELQADCYAGVWANSADARGVMGGGDLQEGLTAAAAVGDDRLARQAGRIPNAETFTHGTSAQRTHWFETGYDTGDPQACDTFASM